MSIWHGDKFTILPVVLTQCLSHQLRFLNILSCGSFLVLVLVPGGDAPNRSSVIILVNVIEKLFHTNLTISLSLLDIFVHLLFDVNLNALELGQNGQLCIDQPLPEAGDGVPLLPHLLDLLPGPVAGAGVRHGVAVVTVGGDLIDQGTLLLNSAVVDGKPDGFSDCEDIHSVHEDAGDVVPALEELCRGCMSLSGGSHAVVVVLTDEYRWQLPQLGQIEGLGHLALVCRAVSVQAEGGASVIVVFLSEGYSSSKGHLGPHNTVASVEVLGVHVHAAALSPHTAGLAASQLSQNPKDGNAHDVGEAVSPVGGDDGVLGPDGGLHARVDRLLAGAEVTKAPDSLLLVQVGGGGLHPPDGHHLVVDPQPLLPGQGGGGGGSIVQVMQLVSIPVKCSLSVDGLAVCLVPILAKDSPEEGSALQESLGPRGPGEEPRLSCQHPLSKIIQML